MSHFSYKEIADKTYSGLVDCATLVTKIVENKVYRDESPQFRREMMEKLLEHMKITVEKPMMSDRDCTDIRASIAQARQYLAS